METEPKQSRRVKVYAFFRGLGPGLITGAADDDPSGISTYATAGAAYGFGLLWTVLFTLPPIAMIAGVVMDYGGLNAIKLLFWSAVLNGVLAPPLIVIILLVCNNPRVMGRHINGKVMNALGVIAALVMSLAALAVLIAWARSWV